MNILKRIFQRKPKAILLDNTFRIVPAFELKGVTYYMHEDPLNAATGRGLTAMMHMEELVMRCSANYLKLHIEAVEKIFNNPRKIDLPNLIRLHNNLKDRVQLLSVMPEHVFKMASVVFFTKEESPFNYDPKFNETKIAAWRESGNMYDFFLQTPLKTLLPFLALPEASSKDYLKVAEKLNQMHLKDLSNVLSKNVSRADT